MSEQVPPDEKEPNSAPGDIVWVGETERPAQIVFPDGGVEDEGAPPEADPQPATPAIEPAQPEPEPAMAATPQHASGVQAATLPTPASQSKALAEAVVSSFVDRLIAEATRKGGYLTVSDLQEMNREFEKKAEALQAVFEKSFEDYVRARERAAWDRARDYPFDRQMVERFARLFPERSDPSRGEVLISRRMLPGFFMATTMMLGPEVVEDFQERCRAILKRLKDEKQEAFSWDDVSESEEMNEVILESIVGMASYFESLHKRVEWFVTIINSHLAPADVEREGEATANWQLTGEAFLVFLGALFAEIREIMSTETGRLRMTKKYGGEACAALFDILQQLDDAGVPQQPV
ncbi:MAG: hypothetical protein QGI63_00565 [Rhodospirillales bacterium]|jgi:hypothetical protein|nr:hypothetical protein [Rhodospirillales bacterium]MDP6772737.1 hypothetical protein [Rhodospirillales bacterium]